MTAPAFHGVFPHHWTAEILPRRPMILPSRHYVYPGQVEEVERGALEVLIQPGGACESEQPFLATCALGFRDPAAPSGLWACPNPDWLCAVSGGYAYLIDTAAPQRFTMLRYRPVLEVLPYTADSGSESAAELPALVDGQHPRHHHLLLFAGHHSILAWGRDGEAWESDRLSSEGLTNLRIEDGVLCGEGWDMRTDKDVPFALDLMTGARV